MEAALNFVVGMLAQQIKDETALVLNFKKDLNWLKTRLEMLTSAVRFADEHDTHDNLQKQWIGDVREILWDAQDILDDYSLHQDIPDVAESEACSSQAQQKSFPYKRKFKEMKQSISSPCKRKLKEMKVSRTMGRQIKEIKKRMKSIMERANELQLIRGVACLEIGTSASTFQPGGKWKKSSIIEYGSFPVAVDIKVQEIVERLEESAVQVLAVVGMGGIGKSFLVQHVYNKVKHMFQDSVWLSVSQTYSLEQLQRDLAFKLDLKDLASSNVSCTIVAEGIHDRLMEKKCLIVLDDVWRATQEDDLLRSLGIPIGVNNQCKVIVTSRNTQVFSHLHPFIYRMTLLSAEDSWKLFCAHAFPSCHEYSPPNHLKEVAYKIEKACGRLPLAIKTVASSLAAATTSTKWESKLHQLKEVRRVNPDDPIMQILKLSYYWLPSCLKPCFAYLSFFPEDEDIDCEYLVNLWIVEGLVPQTENQVDMAWDYLRQLANLCLVDVRESLEFVDGVYYTYRKYCRVHDLVLELAIDISRENKSAFSVQEASGKCKNSSCRRILLRKKGINDRAIADSKFRCSHVVRTLSLSQNSISNSIPLHLLSNARVLRVLDLSNTRISTLPESVGDLKLLRLLNLSGTKLKELPQCVRKLKTLNFLDVSRCVELRRLPLWIGELASLQHLNIERTSLQLSDHISKGVSKLMSLRILRSEFPLSLWVEHSEYFGLEDVGNMTSLQELRIRIQTEVETTSLAEGVHGRLVKLRTLQLRSDLEGLCPIPLGETLKDTRDLQALHLRRNFVVPGCMRGFENLRILDLRKGCDCSELYPELETMGNLTVLRLMSDENCREFPTAFGKRGGFPNLRVFEIFNFIALEELPEMEDGAMPSLERLAVYKCRRVRNVPRGFQGLKRLRQFRFIESGTDECRSRLKEEWSTVQANNQHLRVYIE